MLILKVWSIGCEGPWMEAATLFHLSCFKVFGAGVVSANSVNLVFLLNFLRRLVLMKSRSGKSVLIVVAAALFVLSGSARAVLLPIDNPGFEDPVLADGDWSWSMDNQGWGCFDNDGYQGSWNVTTADYPGEAPEGQNVGWAEPALGVPGGFAQVLLDEEAVLKAGWTYTLTVEVGNALTYDWGGYLVQLLAGGTPHTPGIGDEYTGPVIGGTLLAEDDNSLTIAAGTFETSTVTYTYDPAHSGLLGEPLQIRLLALPGGDEVEFDNVRLEAIPEPATLALLGLGALMLKRKRS